jgi:hypothetical protein
MSHNIFKNGENPADLEIIQTNTSNIYVGNTQVANS